MPLALYSLHRKGVFEENFSFAEFKYIARIAIMMHLIDLAGHAAFKFVTQSVVDKHISLNEEAMVYKKK